MPLGLCPVLYRRVMKDITGAGMSVKIEQDHEGRFLMVLRKRMMGLWNVDPHAAPPAAQPSPAFMTDAV